MHSLWPLLERTGTVDITVRVRPGAHRCAVKGQMADGSYKVDIAAVPEDGQANEALLKFLIKESGLPGVTAEVITGKTARVKKVRMRYSK